MAEELSPKQQRILQFLHDFIEEKDYPPSIRDIQQGCDISSTSVVDYNLKKLEEKGYIRRDREVSRAIELLGGSGERRRRPVSVPLLGKIAAGLPIPTPPDTTSPGAYAEQIEVTEEQIGGRRDVFALRVEGNSMIDALIQDGDIVILEGTHSADDGDMVAVWLREENETTLKRFYHEGERVRLQPMNQSMKPIYTAADNVEVQGKVVTAIRQSF
jgi:repressor LexA